MAQKPSVNPAPVAKKRAPNGCVSDKPVPVRFMGDEREVVSGIAADEQRTLGGTVRLLALMGLEVYRANGNLLAINKKN